MGFLPPDPEGHRAPLCGKRGDTGFAISPPSPGRLLMGGNEAIVSSGPRRGRSPHGGLGEPARPPWAGGCRGLLVVRTEGGDAGRGLCRPSLPFSVSQPQGRPSRALRAALPAFCSSGPQAPRAGLCPPQFSVRPPHWRRKAPLFYFYICFSQCSRSTRTPCISYGPGHSPPIRCTLESVRTPRRPREPLGPVSGMHKVELHSPARCSRYGSCHQEPTRNRFSGPARPSGPVTVYAGLPVCSRWGLRPRSPFLSSVT